MELMAKSIQLYGKVQNVGFRYYVYRLACELGVKGFVKNASDGSVQIEAECEDRIMDIFVDHCKKGSPHSVVNECKINQIMVRNYKDFKIC